MKEEINTMTTFTIINCGSLVKLSWSNFVSQCTWGGGDVVLDLAKSLHAGAVQAGYPSALSLLGLHVWRTSSSFQIGARDMPQLPPANKESWVSVLEVSTQVSTRVSARVSAQVSAHLLRRLLDGGKGVHKHTYK